jgi:hypothetical protein
MLSDPTLLAPTDTTVRVVWFTEFPGERHGVELDGRFVPATTTVLSRTAEDADSRVPGRTWSGYTPRPIWRHEALVDGLAPGERRQYRAVSDAVTSDDFTLTPAPSPGDGKLILLTSDHQLRPMTAANLQLAYEAFGDRLGAVFHAGDLVNVADRASQWFDDAGGCAYFPTAQGRAAVTMAGRSWRGGKLLQHVPLYPALGNHEVMGKAGGSLDERFDLAQPGRYDTTTYEEIFRIPRWYATTVGDVRLIVLFATRMWRPSTWDGSERGTFAEATANLDEPELWGHGQHIFASISEGSEQYAWLAAELAGEEAHRARFRVVMLHHPIHSIGWPAAPAFADPVPLVDRDPATGAVTRVRYEYPANADQLLRDVEPLLSRHGVQLVLNGHTHMWGRFRNAAGVHFLETSNVGNTFGAYPVGGPASRYLPGPEDGWRERYVRQGDAGGLEPIVPAVAPEVGSDGTPLPHLASDTVTAFSLLDTGAGVVRSYRFDTIDPDSTLVLFDEFALA